MNKKKKRLFGGNQLFKEIRFEVMKVHFLLQLLNAAIVFFAINIVLTLFNMSYWFSAAIAVLFFLWRITKSWRKDTLHRLEQGNPEVHEILRTAYEHREEESLMVQGLLYDLRRKLSTVSAGVLIEPKELVSKLSLVAALAFIPLLIVSFAPDIIQSNPLRNIDVDSLVPDGQLDSWDDVVQATLNRSQANLGDADVAQLGDQALDISVVTGGGSVSFENTQDAEQRSFRFNEFPIDVDVQEAEAADSAQLSESDIALINEFSCTTKGQC